MAITVTSDLTLVNTTGGDAEVLTNWASIGTWGSGVAVSADVYLQGSNAINGRVSAAAGPVETGGWYHLATQSANTDYTDGRHVFLWIKCFSLPGMDVRARGGLRISISSDATPTLTGTIPWSGATNSKQWFVSGSDYNITSGWICYVVDPTSTPDLSIGSPAMNSVDRVGLGAAAVKVIGGGSVKPQPIIWDATRYGTYIMLKTTAGETAKFSDYYDTDSTSTNQWGIVGLVGGIYTVQGKIKIGDSAQTAATVFTDTNQTLVWQDHRVASGFYELIIQGASGNTTTATLGSISGSLTSGGCTIRGVGLTTQRLIAATLVAGGTGYTANDILTVSGGTGTVSATMRVISVSGGAVTSIQMENGGSYSVPPTGTLTLTGGTGSNCTATATAVGGSVWTLTATNSYQTLNLYSSTLSEMKSAALASTTTIDGCTILNSGEITVSGATIKNCTFQDMRTAAPMSAAYQLRVTGSTPTLTGNKYVNCATALLWDRNADTNTKLDNSTFISGGTGYGIELGTNTPSSITLNNVTFSGYGSDSTTNAAIYNNSGKSITINITGTGTSPTVNNGAGASTTVVAGTVTVAVTVKDSSTPPVAIQNVNVLVYADSGGPFPSNATVTITNSGTTATVTHTSHGMATGDKVMIKGASLQANNGVYTITYISSSSYSYTMGSSPGSNPTGTIKAWYVALYGLTDGTGGITMSRVFSSAQPIIGRARKATTGTLYKTANFVGTISASAGYSTTVQMIEDV